MLIYLARRLALALVTCAAISVLTFVIIRLPPGDFVDAYIANLAVGGSRPSRRRRCAGNTASTARSWCNTDFGWGKSSAATLACR